eukprot:TRINITY_DN80393_c0_g1_i1.p1 TRINITY_DN80393_c0_g1~~TRINITY_DN80393_c0_g1_i1.p1  ORF type:complete len:316 (+),score=72.74 TRINITY_DN80393_c0_g1_i1:96-1043(+)
MAPKEGSDGECRPAFLCARPPAQGPTKRRPQVRSLSRPTPRQHASGDCGAAATPPLGGANAALVEEVRRLKQCNEQLQTKCDSQEEELARLREGHRAESRRQGQDKQEQAQEKEELARLRARVRELEQRERERVSAEQAAVADRCTQTAESHASAAAVGDELLAEDTWSNERARELRKTQETVRALRVELHQERKLSEQYRSQMEVLEEQARCAMEMRRQTTQDELKFLSRPSSARSSRAGPPSRPSSASRPGTAISGSVRSLSAWSGSTACCRGDSFGTSATAAPARSKGGGSGSGSDSEESDGGSSASSDEER